MTDRQKFNGAHGIITTRILVVETHTFKSINNIEK
jgi:hypothetical protein